MNQVPDKGDIVILHFNPQLGHEQAGTRPCLIISPLNFNKATGLAFVCPITNQQKGYPFEVNITGTTKTTGVILSDQLKSLDWHARKAKVVDKVDKKCIEQVEELVKTILFS
ncbi:endoribonuclease MazF [Candidatus Halobeggiatoa sp. HSG11]|nr:endoribonuclease MazF [Candidatus Halobeggiatoa sp. HSG11]